jgi:hypothetical protein
MYMSLLWRPPNAQLILYAMSRNQPISFSASAIERDAALVKEQKPHHPTVVTIAGLL